MVVSRRVFFSKATKKSKAGKTESSEEAVPYITGAADGKKAKEASLQLPEVQAAVKQLSADTSWVTPQLLQAISSRPDLLQSMSKPKMQEAMQLMQKDPKAAKEKYRDDKEVQVFLKQFSGLMATHFDVLGKEQAPKATTAAPAPALAPAPAQAQAAPNIEYLSPEVRGALEDPEVQATLQALRAGSPLEMHTLLRNKPRLFQRLKILLDAGLVHLQT
eukprot:NODE_11564_length_1278_cov_3.715899.p2 GENE.NODE_11564_length_1278_cov_3.715899~~NODE_11564_length_1278_cov_3.715899.p2  ORF type:complete len:218 (-),score=76.35 NODE_11564_length_1278_cov_3.715899:207-860(-)